MTERLFGRGRRGGVLLIAGAVLGAAVAGPGATIAQKAMNLTTTTADKRYVRAGSVVNSGAVAEAPLSKFTAAAFQSIAQTTIKAPGPGTIAINANLSAKDDATVGAAPGSKLQYRLNVGSTPLSTSATSFELFLPHAPAAPGDETRQNGSVTGFFKVARKGPQTIDLQAQVAGGGSVDILGRSISATFVPKGKIVATKKGKGKGGTDTGKTPSTGKTPVQ
jgi:hypothetical protein